MRSVSGSHRRTSIRSKGYDYLRPGVYFVTVCVSHRDCLLGEIIDGQMRINVTGQMVHSVWYEIPKHYAGVSLDAFVVMPNHIHGLIVIDAVAAGPRARPFPARGQPQGVAPTMSLPDVVHRFKSMTTTFYRRAVIQKGLPSPSGKLWQRNYYEHIARNENELNRIREYISTNPLRWESDPENPAARRNPEEEFPWEMS